MTFAGFRRLLALGLGLFLCLLAARSLGEITVTLTFTGDCTLGSEELTRGHEDSFDAVAAREGEDYFLKNFRALFSRK